jgi:hypothetical protein
MCAGQSKEYYIDRNLDSYKSFFDHEWAKRFLDEADNANLADLAFNLCEGWKGAANTGMLPWLTIENLGNFAESFCNAHRPDAAHILDALAARLAREVQPPLAPTQQQCLERTIGAINGDLTAIKRSHPFKFDRVDAWNTMLENAEFAIAVVASRRIVYADMYFSYEDFLISCFRRASGQPSYQVGRSFPADLSGFYGPAIALNIWSDPEVKIARLVRHAIVHNGARETPELAKAGHSIGVIGGALQITPSATRVAFNCLKDRAMVILKETANRVPKPGT